jgi:hypothetical protein
MSDPLRADYQRRFICLPSMYGLRGWRELIGAEVLNPAWALRPRQGLSASRSLFDTCLLGGVPGGDSQARPPSMRMGLGSSVPRRRGPEDPPVATPMKMRTVNGHVASDHVRSSRSQRRLPTHCAAPGGRSSAAPLSLLLMLATDSSRRG